jgi:hypothetical protein
VGHSTLSHKKISSSIFATPPLNITTTTHHPPPAPPRLCDRYLVLSHTRKECQSKTDNSNSPRCVSRANYPSLTSRENCDNTSSITPLKMRSPKTTSSMMREPRLAHYLRRGRALYHYSFGAQFKHKWTKFDPNKLYAPNISNLPSVLRLVHESLVHDVLFILDQSLNLLEKAQKMVMDKEYVSNYVQRRMNSGGSYLTWINKIAF